MLLRCATDDCPVLAACDAVAAEKVKKMRYGLRAAARCECDRSRRAVLGRGRRLQPVAPKTRRASIITGSRR